MSVLNVLVHPNSILRTPCVDVVSFDADLKQTVADMFQTMAVQNGVGLAAPQVGITQRFFVMAYKQTRLVLINPVLFDLSGRKVAPEGCLSIPGVQVSVERATRLKARFQDLSGQMHTQLFKGFLARIIQHEFDHLNGVLICDKGPSVPVDSSDEMCDVDEVDAGDDRTVSWR